jgi:HSP20 family protein
MEMRNLLPSLWGREGEGRDAFRSLQREIDRVFDDFGRFNVPTFGLGGDNGWSPRVDISETDKALEVTAELPGVDEKDVDVTLADNVLTIKGEKRAEKEEKNKNFQRVERSYGMFQRSIPLPFEADSSKVEASFNKGVLKVTLPKPAGAKAKTQKIAIKSSA